LANLSTGKAPNEVKSSSYQIPEPLSSLELGAWSLLKFWPSTRGCATQAGMTQAITYHVEFPA